MLFGVGEILDEGVGEKGGGEQTDNDAEFSASVFDESEFLDEGGCDVLEAEGEEGDAEMAEDGRRWVLGVEKNNSASEAEVETLDEVDVGDEWFYEEVRFEGLLVILALLHIQVDSYS